MPKKRRSDAPFKEWREIQDHRYDPGHGTGSHIHPIYRRRREGNPSGYLLLVLGAFAIAAGVVGALHGERWAFLQTVIALMAGVIMIIAGTRLLVKTKPHD